MTYEAKELPPNYTPPLLSEIPKPPSKLFYAGNLPNVQNYFLCVVGSRKYSTYGKDSVEYLIEGLKGFPINIVSGLALGIDAFAHKSALKVGLPTIAVPGSGLLPSVLHPQTHIELAKKIVENGGTLLSEYEPNFKATHYSFPQRNRIMAGMSHATLIIEAGEKSGTLITARLAADYNRELLCVPGSIFSQNSSGTNMFLRLGATLVRSPSDILEALKIESDFKAATHDYSECSETEKVIIEILSEPRERDEIINSSGLPVSEIQMALTVLELKGYIKEELGEIRLIR